MSSRRSDFSVAVQVSRSMPRFESRKMPAIWPSSERPISVRMVWVDGVRHAILSQDDPLLKAKAARRRPQTSSSAKERKFSRQEPSEAGFDGCFVKLRLVVDKADSDGLERACASRTRLQRWQSAPICARLARSSSLDEAEAARRPREDEAAAGRDDGDEASKRVEMPQLNTLSERVLQWLDLSGKVRQFDEPAEDEKQPAPRRKYSSFKDEGTSVRIVVPTQYLMLQDKAALELCERKAPKSQAGLAKEAEKLAEPARKSADDHEDDEGGKSPKSLWTPPGKPQLHIFMPSLKPTEIHWMSSQESLFCD